MAVTSENVHRLVRIGTVVAPVVAGLGTVWASDVDLKWMMAAETGIPADIQVNRAHGDQGQIVLVGTAPRYVESADYMRKIGADEVGIP